MKIAGTQYTLNKNSFEIYLSGCTHRCSNNCHNKELWDFSIGDDYNIKYLDKLKGKINKFNRLIDKITIFGGEPLDQNKVEFLNFLKDIKTLNKEIWLFTSYKLEEVDDEILKLCDYIKIGKYDEALKGNNEKYGYFLASTNQDIIKLN